MLIILKKWAMASSLCSPKGPRVSFNDPPAPPAPSTDEAAASRAAMARPQALGAEGWWHWPRPSRGPDNLWDPRAQGTVENPWLSLGKWSPCWLTVNQNSDFWIGPTQKKASEFPGKSCFVQVWKWKWRFHQHQCLFHQENWWLNMVEPWWTYILLKYNKHIETIGSQPLPKKSSRRPRPQLGWFTFTHSKVDR